MSMEKLQAAFRAANAVAPEEVKRALGGRNIGQVAEGEIAGLIVRLDGIRASVAGAIDVAAPVLTAVRSQERPAAEAAKPRPAAPSLGSFFGLGKR